MFLRLNFSRLSLPKSSLFRIMMKSINSRVPSRGCLIYKSCWMVNIYRGLFFIFLHRNLFCLICWHLRLRNGRLFLLHLLQFKILFEIITTIIINGTFKSCLISVNIFRNNIIIKHCCLLSPIISLERARYLITTSTIMPPLSPN